MLFNELLKSLVPKQLTKLPSLVFHPSLKKGGTHFLLKRVVNGLVSIVTYTKRRKTTIQNTAIFILIGIGPSAGFSHVFCGLFSGHFLREGGVSLNVLLRELKTQKAVY